MCPPCKIIIDCGVRLPAALRRLARSVADSDDAMAVEALHYAEIAEGAARAIIFAIEHPKITTMEWHGSHDEAIERAHAWSELSCHRAKLIRETANLSIYENPPSGTSEGAPIVTAELLAQWADEHATFATELFGGEYHGTAWIVDGVTGIRDASEE